MPRTQDEVDALWPKDADQYSFLGHVAIKAPVNDANTMAWHIQRLYERRQAMAGSFEVNDLVTKAVPDYRVFAVNFQRDVVDDYDVVNDHLLAGGDFDAVLQAQLEIEFQLANKDKSGLMHLFIINGPIFSYSGAKVTT